MPQVTADQAIQIALQHHRQGELPQAEMIYRQVLAQQPNNHDALQLLGAIAYQAGRYDAAVDLIAKAAALAPSHAHYHGNLGMALLRLGRRDPAQAAFARAVAIDANHADAHVSLGDIALDQGKWDPAVTHYRAALRIKPELSAAHNNLAHALHHLGHPEQAIESCRDAIRHKPDFAEAHANLGGLLLETGQVFEAIENLRGALVLRPDLPAAHSNLLYSMHFDPGVSPQAMFDEHQAWARRHAEPLAGEARPHDGIDRNPERRLRVGYLSPSFRDHPVGRFIEPLIEAHDRAQVEVHLFSDVAAPDGLTERARRHADAWHEVRKLSDAQLADAVRAAKIDILVDLAGHTAGNRLLAFARRPAPVQATYLGYPDTTGMAAMDYRITDEQADPTAAEAFCTEQLIRLGGGFLCYRPPDALPDVASPPCEVTGHVTFGSFNNLAKVSSDVIALWARILSELPTSRLLLKSAALGEEANKRRVRRAFAAFEIDSRRLDLRGREASHAQHLSTYAGVDVALDSFPYNGMNTTCEALAMGIPVVTLAGPAHASRIGASILTHIGREEWVAADADEYIFKAVSLAADTDRLRAVRGGLRERVLRSPLGDAPAFARKLEAAYRTMWTTWCVGGGGGGALAPSPTYSGERVGERG